VSRPGSETRLLDSGYGRDEDGLALNRAVNRASNSNPIIVLIAFTFPQKVCLSLKGTVLKIAFLRKTP
jgi:hypothetical protein